VSMGISGTTMRGSLTNFNHYMKQIDTATLMALRTEYRQLKIEDTQLYNEFRQYPGPTPRRREEITRLLKAGLTRMNQIETIVLQEVL
jgi:hypothetical protein